MKFLIQHNLIAKSQLELAAKAVENLPHQFVGVIPFEHEITSDEPIVGEDYIPYGSTLLTNLAFERKWSGLYFDQGVMNYSNFVANRKDMLNAEHIMPVKDAIRFLANQMEGANLQWFTRPSVDLKHYAGYVGETKEIAYHLQSMVNSFERGELGTYGLNPQNEIVLARPKTIQAEWRWFIIGGNIVSGSMYRAHGQLRPKIELDAEVINEAQELADVWLPYPCVVMDTALVDNEMKVIEFNCINSSGFYDHGVNKIFKEWWDWEN